mmetsp:Transcript_7399/g.12465  ORF Transcript_7399/g.12465 Transcript_7399/m.12465 type:complete len:317 (-) Transcript_7399:1155-2105(-)
MPHFNFAMMYLSLETNGLQVFPVGPRVFQRGAWHGRITVLLDRAPSLEPCIQQALADGGKINIALPQVTEDALPAGGVEIGALGDDICLYNRVYIFEMHIGNTAHVPIHERHRVKACIAVMAGVETDFQNLFIHLVQQAFQFRLKVHEARRMGMDAHGQAVFFGPHFGNGCNAVAVRRPLCLVHLLRLVRAARCRGAAGRNAVDQHQMLRPVRRQRFAGAQAGIHHVIPHGRIVKGAKHDTSNDFQITLGQRRGKDRGVFGHVADRPQLNPFIARTSALIQNGLPGGIGWIAGKFDAPGTGRVADLDRHLGGLSDT